MITLEELESKGKQLPEHDDFGTFTIEIFSPYFKKEVRLNFMNQKNTKDENELAKVLRDCNEFIQLNESNIGWIKETIWKNCLYAFEGTDYGFETTSKSPQLDKVTLEQITILKSFPTANIDNIKKNMSHFKIFNKEDALMSSTINQIDISKYSIDFHISSQWDEEHDIVIYTKNYGLTDVAC